MRKCDRDRQHAAHGVYNRKSALTRLPAVARTVLPKSGRRAAFAA